ncbi:MAG: EndoU domain-containing protein [Oscillospiraceae bacterium]|nr:EndoU domain-containing protein [Oscillospiraceae bacterium]
MGTSKNGRYLNTKGSGRSVSDFALVHSSEGAFVRSQVRVNGKVEIKLRLNNGGHSQKGMNLLDKYDIKYNIVKTYPNGVRVGNVPNHMKRAKRKGMGQAWFPKSWSDKDIRRAGEHVAGLKGNRRISDGKIIYGTYNGVRVCVIRTNGKIATVFPDSNQSSAVRRKHK